MASSVPRLRSQVIAIAFAAVLYATATSCSSIRAANAKSESPEFDSVVVTKSRLYVNGDGPQRMVEFEARGRGVGGGLPVRTTLELRQRGRRCAPKEMTGYSVSEVWSDRRAGVARYAVHLPASVVGTVHFCLPRPDAVDDIIIAPAFSEEFSWYHQGDVGVRLDGLDLDTDREHNAKQLVGRIRRQQVPNTVLGHLRVTGLRVDVAYKEPHLDDDGTPYLLAGNNYTLRLFGIGFSEAMLITFTQQEGVYGGACQIPATAVFPVIKDTLTNDSVRVEVHLPAPEMASPFYVCVKEGTVSSTEFVGHSRPFVHQGSSPLTRVGSFEKVLPTWAAFIIICVCLCFSALFSGLNLGLMSLDRTELKILCNTGTTKEKQYANKIQPVRNHGNYLLCSILLGNVLVNSTFTILLDDLTSGLVAIICSTLAIVIFGEITPQALCSRHGLAIGAKTIVITKIVMGITFPLSYPISKILDVLLGEEIGSVYTRERLKELVKVTTGENDLDRDEVNIISGALELRRKTVADVMTRIEDAFMLDYEAILDFETVSEIMKSGYSRIPVFQNDRKNIVTTLFIKDLAFVDPDDNTPLKTLCQFYQNPCNFVFEDVTLDIMFKDFKEGNKGHMAFVKRVNSEGEGDPFYETIGLITLEDVIEELIQAEIMDETDVFTDNRTKRRRNADRTKQDFTIFADRKGENNKLRISPQLTLATFQYLSTSVDLFKPPTISETILRRLLKQDIFYHIKKNKEWRKDPTNVIYQQGKPVDYFVLILEGRVEVTVGTENLNFESGPFTFFGTQALIQNVGVAESPSTIGSLQSLNMDSMLKYTFQPDYSVRACTEVLYMRVKRNLYLAAKRASLMEKSQKDTTGPDQFDDEVEMLLHSLDDDSSIGRNSPEPPPKPQIQSAQVNHTSAAQHTHGDHSPRTPSLKSHMSPTTGLPRPLGSRELNGSVRHSSTVDEITGKEEELSLLSNKS